VTASHGHPPAARHFGFRRHKSRLFGVSGQHNIQCTRISPSVLPPVFEPPEARLTTVGIPCLAARKKACHRRKP